MRSEVRTPWARLILSAGMAAVILSLAASPAAAQAPPWPNGCSIAGGVQWVQQGLDRLFLGACNRHDRCWAQCNGPNPPFLGLGHKAQCDAQFFVEMEAACVVASATLSLPIDDIDTTQEFLEVCAGAVAAFSAIVASPATNGIFWASQCTRGCNPTNCPINPLCGNGLCYVTPPPIPPIDPCIFVNCDNPDACVGPSRRCCDCDWPPGEC